MSVCRRVPGVVCHVCIHDSSSACLERFAGDSSGFGGHGADHICVYTFVSDAQSVYNQWHVSVGSRVEIPRGRSPCLSSYHRMVNSILKYTIHGSKALRYVATYRTHKIHTNTSHQHCILITRDAWRFSPAARPYRVCELQSVLHVCRACLVVCLRRGAAVLG